MNNSNTKLKVNILPSRLKCDVNSKVSAIINRFTNTHTPLLAYKENREFIGLVTVQNTLFNRRHDPSTLVSSCLITPPRIFIDTPISEILRLMSGLKLYTLPVFNKSEKVIGLVEAKSLLKNLMTNDFFSEEMIKNVPRRNVLTIPKNSDIGNAFQNFQKYSVSQLVVVDGNNKMKGIITKGDIFGHFFSNTSKQRFSTRSKIKNYSFDVEKIKQDKQSLMKFASPVFDELYETKDALKVIETLITSRHNSIVIINKDHQPLFIYTTGDLLKTAVWITKKTPTILIIINKLPQELSEEEKNKVNREIRATAVWINKQYKVQLVRFSSKTVYNPDRKPILFEIKLKITTDSATFFADNKDRDFMQNLKKVIGEIKKQVRRIK